MISSPAMWEADLLSLALSAAATPCRTVAHGMENGANLQAAYAYCEALTAAYSRSFFLASRFLPTAQRQACRALYAFCRISDDLVDQPSLDPAGALADWRAMTLGEQVANHHPVAFAFQETCQRYRIPVGYAHQLLDGVAVDLHQSRYQTFAELSRYCYGVAGTVGLMSMQIIGFAGSEAVPYALKLGIALQMTNILRDVGEDWQAGRLYLPLEELAAFGLTTADVAQGQVSERWRALMRFQIARTRQLYAGAKPGLALLNGRGRVAIAAAAELYGAILAEIEQLDYNVFAHRANVPTGKKVWRLFGAWLAA